MTRIYKYGLAELQACVNLSDLARLLEVKPQFLSHQVYIVPPARRYSLFTMEKKGGGIRGISAPNKNLKFIQSRLSRLLYQCYDDIFGPAEELDNALSHGFQKARGLSIYTNAKRHTGRRHVFNVDIENFLPQSILAEFEVFLY